MKVLITLVSCFVILSLSHTGWTASHLESEKTSITKEQQDALDQLIKSLEILRSNPKSMKLVEEWFETERKKSEEELTKIDTEIAALQKQLEELSAKKDDLQKKLKTLQSGQKLISRLSGNAIPETENKDTAKPASVENKESKAAQIFARDIKPIIEVHCIACHGEKEPGGELTLLTREGVLKGGAVGKVIAPGNPEQSVLYKMVTHEAEPYMPLGADKLAAADLEKIAAWIRAEK